MIPALRIAMLTHSTNPRGGVVHAMQVAEALQCDGHEVTLHAPDATGDGFFRAARCELRAFKVLPAPPNTFGMVESRIADYVKYFSGEPIPNYDIHHAHDGISGNALATLRARGQVKRFVRTIHHLDDFADARLKALQNRSIVEADACFVVSPMWRDCLARTYGIEAQVCGNGVDREKFRVETDAGDATLRSRLKIGPGPLFLCVGGVEERKNIVRILDAFRLLLKERPDAELAIAGGASLLDHSQYHAGFAAALDALGGSAASVHRLGVIEDADMPRLYRSAAALVFASTREGFGLCVIEALACGAPVVVSRIAPFTDYLNSGDAIWCDPTDPRSIAGSMAMALDAAYGATLRRSGPLVAKNFNWGAVARSVAAVYQRLQEPALA